jgi:uncharacterized protein YcfJ
MKTHSGALLAAVVVVLAACATMGGYRPTVDPHASRIPRDESKCRELALQASGGTANRSVLGAAVGGLLGAAGGAAIGAAEGSPGTGAAVGAAAGGLGGGAYEGLSAEERFRAAFRNCMRERGHKVID